MERRIIHVFYTWLLAVGLHPFFWRLIIMRHLFFGFEEDFLLLLLSFVFSIPSFLLCLFAIKPVVMLNVKPIFRFFIWMILATSSVLCVLLVLLALFGKTDMFFNLALGILPGSLAAVLSVIIRYKYFFHLLKQTTDNAE